MTNLNLTERQITIISIALSHLYAKFDEGDEGSGMRHLITELHKYIIQQHQEAQK